MGYRKRRDSGCSREKGSRRERQPEVSPEEIAGERTFSDSLQRDKFRILIS